MLLDLCCGLFGTVIQSDKVSLDHYEASNLVSTDPSCKNRGYIAESFIKPPVKLTITLPFNVELYRININPINGRQKCSSFEIYTFDEKISPQDCFSEKWLKKDASQFLFQPLAKFYSKEPQKVSFLSYSYKPWNKWRSNDSAFNSSDNSSVYMRHHRVSYLSNVSHVVIRITQTFGGSAVCLKSLEIWGQPSRSTSRTVLQRLDALLDVYDGNLRSVADDVKQSNLLAEDNSARTSLHNGQIIGTTVISGIQIPEEFMDKITFEIMTVPMLLPSGENIDQLTLEKHISAEASWGRQPTDPFTGQLLKGRTQAVPNAGLKSRIDAFVLSHSGELGNLPMTLGRGGKKPLSQTASYSLLCGKRKLNSLREIDSECDKSHMEKKSCDYLDKTRDEGQEGCGCTNVKKRLKKDSAPHYVPEKSDHSSNLKFSLDSALSEALGTLPNFTNDLQDKKSDFFSSAKSDSSEMNKICCRCKVNLSMSAYSGNCKHYACKTCLLNSSNPNGVFLCNICETVWSKSDICRVFL